MPDLRNKERPPKKPLFSRFKAISGVFDKMPAVGVEPTYGTGKTKEFSQLFESVSIFVSNAESNANSTQILRWRVVGEYCASFVQVLKPDLKLA